MIARGLVDLLLLGFKLLGMTTSNHDCFSGNEAAETQSRILAFSHWDV